jgi:hypothetical protein
MIAPSFLGPYIQIAQGTPFETTGAGAGKTLPFHMQTQEPTNWCWAATSVSVSIYYTPASTWTQCAMVNKELKQLDCCTNGKSDNCNKRWRLDLALKRAGNFAKFLPGAGSFQDVLQEVNAGRPFGCRVEWAGGEGHFVVLAGWRSGGGVDYVDVYDPLPHRGHSQIPIDMFTNAYKGIGRWTERYFTRSPETA